MSQFGGNTTTPRFGAGATQPRPVLCRCRKHAVDPACPVHGRDVEKGPNAKT